MSPRSNRAFPFSSKLRVEQLDDRLVPDGLTASYFANATLSGTPAVSRVDSTVDFNWGSESPASAVPADRFSVRWTGDLNPPASGTYKFETFSDDGIRLWVNNILVIDQWNDHVPTAHTGSIALTANTRVPIRLEYYENLGGATARLTWTPPGREKEVIPSSALFNTAVPPSPPPQGGSRYELTSGLATWGQARAEALARGGDLVTINSSREGAILRKYFGDSETLWIGLNDEATEGTFTWANGEPVSYTYWAPGEPNNLNGNEDFAALNFGDEPLWNDWGGETGFRGVIEFPPLPSAGEFALGSVGVSVSENVGVATATIERRNGSAGTVSVEYATTPGSATLGADFLGVSGHVTFLPGETVKTIVIPIVNDSDLEGNESFGFVIGNAQGGATLPMAQATVVTITDDDASLSELFSFPAFVNPATLSLNGNATLNRGGALQLTPIANHQRGSAFFQRPVAVDGNLSFESAFSFRMTGEKGGGEGMTFTLQNVYAGAAALGAGGPQLGYGGLNQSLAIEFDTRQNRGETNNNHVSIHTNGNMSASPSAPAPVDLNDGGTVYAWVEYNGATNRLNVFVSGTNTKPATALLSHVVDVPKLVGDQFYTGFTAATGVIGNDQSVLSWSFASNSRLI